MIRITFINGSYYCGSGKTKLKLKRDSYDRTSNIRRLKAGDIVTFHSIYEDTSGKWITVKTGNYKFFDIRLADLLNQKEHLRR